MKGWTGGSGDLMGGGSKWERSGLVFTGTGGRGRALEMESQRVQPGFRAVAPRLLPTVASARWEHSRSGRSKQSLIGRRGANCLHLLVDLHLGQVLFVSFACGLGSGPTTEILPETAWRKEAIENRLLCMLLSYG